MNLDQDDGDDDGDGVDDSNYYHYRWFSRRYCVREARDVVCAKISIRHYLRCRLVRSGSLASQLRYSRFSSHKSLDQSENKIKNRKKLTQILSTGQ